MSDDFFSQILMLLVETCPHNKATGVQALFSRTPRPSLQPEVPCKHAVTTPGRPNKPQLVSPRELPSRKFSTQVGRMAMAHAIAHIEFNAINLALDAIHRFRHMPLDFYHDWLRVAAEEAKHFSLLVNYMASSDVAYGDFVAHDGLWSLASATKDDVLARMALVPRIMEARGLDVTPLIRRKFEQVGDAAMLEILDIIVAEEIGHVRIGNYWFHWLCQQRHCDATSVFIHLVRTHVTGQIKAPFAKTTRLAAGFTTEELALLETLAQ